MNSPKNLRYTVLKQLFDEKLLDEVTDEGLSLIYAGVEAGFNLAYNGFIFNEPAITLKLHTVKTAIDEIDKEAKYEI